ncbi:MAG: hypothetical protein HGB05_04890, partial [Chloroflexi bacterium]|nr:hypothetical protein [Chloroflexota bacterium]
MHASCAVPGFIEPVERDGLLLGDGGVSCNLPGKQVRALGADYVIHSLTKYQNGHGDALGGVVIGPQAGIQTIRKEMLVHLGGAMSPFNAWLILRGLATLPLRMERHCRSAMQVARFLEG